MVEVREVSVSEPVDSTIIQPKHYLSNVHYTPEVKPMFGHVIQQGDVLPRSDNILRSRVPLRPMEGVLFFLIPKNK